MDHTNRIPKIIHYCWFGAKEKPEIVKKCMESWRKNLPLYEIVEWNETNFDIHSNTYVKQAYDAGKFAFVSDYVRVYVLYHYGGIYLDTDVEVFKSFDDLLYHRSFWGFEQENYIATSTIGAERGNVLIKQFLDSYHGKKFLNEDGTFNSLTNVAIITELLEWLGLEKNGQHQEIKGMGVFYPQSYFSPYDYINCRKFLTEHTYTIHYFHKSWLPLKARMKSNMKSILAVCIGGENIARIRKVIGGN
ncbi:glycosyltransferase family 32 protein [Bacillus sp. PS06]|uniref:glycosyltransferase family 32 protein n=1 Tax=Bacillus sp. PS06 TaxID=2764176 RepID=UPI0017858AE0|nr:glycosyltransferase [Bacillus sp. PS06]MBD8071310.1 glycosyl transferase [Bacillus sp. PS06]